MNWLLESALFPPRMTYDLDDTICAITDDYNNAYVRTDVCIPTADGHSIKGSLWRDLSSMNPNNCVIFLHALGMNQFECVHLVPFLCRKDLAIFSFDFQSHGIADGNLIPLIGGGAEDVLIAVDHLKSEFGIQHFSLWGRSMGASIALDVAAVSGSTFKCVVADSGFASTLHVINDQAKMNGFPSLVIGILYGYAKKSTQRRLGTKVDCHFPINHVQHASIPLLLGHGSVDSFIPLEQGRGLFVQYGGKEKQMYIFPGQHNSQRPHQWYESAARFIYRKMDLQENIRDYEYIYASAKLHAGDVDEIICAIYHKGLNCRKREIFLNETIDTRTMSDVFDTLEPVMPGMSQTCRR